MILHIPHSSRLIPAGLRDQFVLSDDELSTELDLMTDAFTNELFALPAATARVFPFSRLVVDVERFSEDVRESMSRVGMGMIYTRTAAGKDLRRALHQEERTALVSLYEAHHAALLREVEAELAAKGHALIIDCHSFSDHPLPCDQDQSSPRPQICIGTDAFHTLQALAQRTVSRLTDLGYTVQVDRPYEGTLVPSAFWNRDGRVCSMMIEINRSLYMDEATGEKTGAFVSVKELLERVLREGVN